MKILSKRHPNKPVEIFYAERGTVADIGAHQLNWFSGPVGYRHDRQSEVECLSSPEEMKLTCTYDSDMSEYFKYVTRHGQLKARGFSEDMIERIMPAVMQIKSDDPLHW